MTRYFPEKRALFLHVPRTGGTWVEYAIAEMGVEFTRWTQAHAQWLPSKHLYLPQYECTGRNRPRFVWTILRHPVSYYEAIWRWLRSVKYKYSHRKRDFRYYLMNHYRWSWHPQKAAAELYDDQFDVWVRRMLEFEGAWVTRAYAMAVGPPGGEWVHYVGRHETLVEDFFAVMDLIGYGDEVAAARDRILGLGRVNAAPEYEITWPEDLLAAVQREERVAIRRWWSDKTQTRRWYGALAQEGPAAVVGDPGGVA